MGELRFDRVEPQEGEAATSACATCGDALPGIYFEVAGQMVCPGCRERLAAELARGTRLGRLGRALAGGVAAAVVGAGLYYAVLALTGYEVGLIAIAVGFLVGGAVRWGCHGRGGWLYQAIAVGLTYVAIVSTYVPFLFAELDDAPPAEAVAAAAAPPQGDAAAATATAATATAAPASAPAAAAGATVGLGGIALAAAAFVALVLALPFLAGFENFLGWLIIGFALLQAWQMNRKRTVVVNGPFQIAAPAEVAAAPAATPAAAPPVAAAPAPG
jgi:hypothetical protein